MNAAQYASPHNRRVSAHPGESASSDIYSCTLRKAALQNAQLMSNSIYKRTRQGSFRWGTRGNAVPIVEKLTNGVPIVKVFKSALWTALRTIFRPKCIRLQHFAYIISNNFTGGATPGTSAEASTVLKPKHQFPLGSPAFPLFLLERNDHLCVCVCPLCLSWASILWGGRGTKRDAS